MSATKFEALTASQDFFHAVEWALTRMGYAARLSSAEPSRYLGLPCARSVNYFAELTGCRATQFNLSRDELLQFSSSDGAIIGRGTQEWFAITKDRICRIHKGEEKVKKLKAAELDALFESKGETLEVYCLEPELGLESLASSKNEKLSPKRRLWLFAVKERSKLLVLIAYSIAVGVLSLAVPVAIQFLVNTIAFGSLLQPLVVLSVMLFAVLSFAGALQLVQWYAVEVLQRRIFVRVTEDFARRIPRVSRFLPDHYDLQELTNRFFDTVNIQKASSKLVLDALGLLLQTLVGLLLLAFYHPLLLAFDILLILSFAVIFLLGRGAVDSAVAESNAKYRVAAWLENLAEAKHLFASIDARSLAGLKADALLREYLRARKIHFAVVLRQLIGGVVIQVAAMVALLGLGGWLVIEGELTLGQLVAAEIVVGIVVVGFSKLGKHLESYYDLLASTEKIGKVLDLPLENSNKGIDSESGFSLLERGLNFKSAKGVELSIEPLDLNTGDMVLVEAENTEALNAAFDQLSDLYFCTSDRSPEKCKGFHSKPGDCFRGSIFENLRSVDVELSEEQAWELLDAVFLHRRVAEFEEGIHSLIHPTTAKFTEGEMARFCLAKVMLAREPVVLLENSFDHLGLEEGDRKVLLTRTFTTLENRVTFLSAAKGLEQANRRIQVKRAASQGQV